MYIIKDWAGVVMNWEGNPFDTAEEAEDVLCEMVDKFTREDMEVDSECIYDNVYEINLGEYQIIEIDEDGE